MTADARTAAFATAWEIAEAAAKWRTEWLKQGHDIVESLPDAYWAMIQEARIFVDLAGVGADVGIPVAEWLQEQERRRDEEAAMATERMEHLLGFAERRVGDEHSCTCEFNKNQCPVHNPDGDPEEIADDDE
jgi:hypothetical protein